MSRQLWWGHRIPAYSVNHGDNNNDSGDNFLSPSSTNNISWIIARSEEEAYSRAREKYGDTVSIHQDPDVLDTWFSSAIIPFVTLGWPKHVSFYYYYNFILIYYYHCYYYSFVIIYFYYCILIITSLYLLFYFYYIRIIFIVADKGHGKVLSINTDGNWS